MNNGDEEKRECDNERKTGLEYDKEVEAGKRESPPFLSAFWFAKVRNYRHPSFRTILTKSFGPLRMGRDPREQITLFICRTGRATAERSSSFLGDENAWFMTRGTRDCTPIPSPIQPPCPSLSLFLFSVGCFAPRIPLFVTSKPSTALPAICYRETFTGISFTYPPPLFSVERTPEIRLYEISRPRN